MILMSLSVLVRRSRRNRCWPGETTVHAAPSGRANNSLETNREFPLIKRATEVPERTFRTCSGSCSDMKSKPASSRSGLLAGGNWIIDQVKLIDVYPQPEQLANIRNQAQGTGGAPYNVLVDLARLGVEFPLS